MIKEGINTKSVQSDNPFKSVIQTNYDIVKAHGGELTVENIYKDLPTWVVAKAGAEFEISLPI